MNEYVALGVILTFGTGGIYAALHWIPWLWESWIQGQNPALNAQVKQLREELKTCRLEFAANEVARTLAEKRVSYVRSALTDGRLDPPHRQDVQAQLLRIAAVLACPFASPNHRNSWCDECLDLQHGKR